MRISGLLSRWRTRDVELLVMYLLGQAIGYGTDLLIFACLMSMMAWDHPLLAHLGGKAGSAALTYFYHARFSFPGEKRNGHASSTFFYVLMVVINILFTSFLLFVLVRIIPGLVVVAKITADVAGVVLTYFIMRFLVFPRAAA